MTEMKYLLKGVDFISDICNEALSNLMPIISEIAAYTKITNIFHSYQLVEVVSIGQQSIR